MDVRDIERFLRGIGASGQIKPSRRWLNVSCPFAPWRHAKGTDRRPSFGISIEPGGESFYRCHACGVSGSVRELLWRLSYHTGHSYPQLFSWVQEKNQPTEADIDRRIAYSLENRQQTLRGRLSTTEYRFRSGPMAQTTLPGVDVASEPQTFLDEHLVEQFRDLPPFVLSYLTEQRRLTGATIDLWELGWQPHARRIVLPVRERSGRLVGLTGRAFDADQEPKFMHSTGFKKSLVLFGEHLVEEGLPGYLVEGHFDALYVRQMGYPNAVAMMGGDLSPQQIRKMADWFPEVVIIPDGDEPGLKIAAEAERKLSGVVPVRVVEPREGYDPDNYTQDELDELLAI